MVTTELRHGPDGSEVSAVTDPPTAPGDESPTRRTTFATTDPDRAREFVDRMYGARPSRTGHPDSWSPVALTQVGAGGMSHVDVTMPRDLTLHLQGTEDLSVITLVAGAVEARLGREVEHYAVGETFLGSFPAGDHDVRCLEVRGTIMTVPAEALDRVAGLHSDRPPQALRFSTLAPTSPEAGALWTRTAAYAHGVLDDDHGAASPLILGATARLLAATALSVFPSNLVDEHARVGNTRATPATVLRAEGYIRAHAHLDVDLAGLAAACDVTPRALQYAFARHHDTSPMRYLRQVRLARAHEDLLAADPDGVAVVTTIAARWGFSHPGRFAAAYRRAYGRTPSATLHP